MGTGFFKSVTELQKQLAPKGGRMAKASRPTPRAWAIPWPHTRNDTVSWPVAASTAHRT